MRAEKHERHRSVCNAQERGHGGVDFTEGNAKRFAVPRVTRAVDARVHENKEILAGVLLLQHFQRAGGLFFKVPRGHVLAPSRENTVAARLEDEVVVRRSPESPKFVRVPCGGSGMAGASRVPSFGGPLEKKVRSHLRRRRRKFLP